ncbi:MAG TPA: beta-ketoacyl-ACP synthase II [Candidatus Merdicola faecigallinarum]|uniref:3-oxoacyl-[acyl-carrier-protein] synthase 2 n=1 Tax=Candidatus Merdicola faecigallinarum TaxID=2840862 RepID=A0A9D1M0E2_9FIRM|nr:beta-ketoacyl-ACP synthase II [Candidatus Merdicola faecigallinarum]
MERRVVVTGMGAITPIGNNVEEFWKGIKEGKCGIDEITQFDTTDYKVKLAAEVKNFSAEDHFDKRTAKRMDRFSQFAIVAAREAMKDSNITKENTDMNRVAAVIGTGIGGLATIEKDNRALVEKGPDRVSPMYIPMSIVNMAAGNVAIDLGIKGESVSMVTACATGTHSIGHGYHMIKHGYEDVVLAGGTEGSITPTGIAGFTNIKALTQETNKNRASIPFDKERSGFVMGEGAGIIVLEELEHAKARGAKIYAEIVGYGATSDAYHITSPSPDGEGAARAMQRAMNEANIKPEEVTYINAHGTSTHLNDAGETLAIKRALGEASKNVLVSSTKGNTGHLLGAAGGVEAIACIKAIENDFVPPTINYQVPDEECDLDVVPNQGRNVEVKYAMSNSLGFGGHNSSILFKKYENK